MKIFKDNDLEMIDKNFKDNSVILNPEFGEYGAYTIEDGVIKDDAFVIGRQIHKYLDKVEKTTIRQKYHNSIPMFNLHFNFPD